MRFEVNCVKSHNRIISDGLHLRYFITNQHLFKVVINNNNIYMY